MKNEDPIKKYGLTEEDKEKLLEEIKYYFEVERDEKLGIIASEKILDFFLETMADYVYNRALDNTKKWYDKRMENLESDSIEMRKYI
jgi:uncharacterized protein (DUF2164 family)